MNSFLIFNRINEIASPKIGAGCRLKKPSRNDDLSKKSVFPWQKIGQKKIPITFAIGINMIS
jgi:hypothetical protein